MIVTIPAQHSAECDRCGAVHDPTDYTDLADLHHDLRVEGWTVEDDVLCRRCTEIVTDADYERMHP